MKINAVKLIISSLGVLVITLIPPINNQFKIMIVAVHYALWILWMVTEREK